MVEYYARKLDGTRIGPISEADFKKGYLSGNITDEWLVWTKGMLVFAPASQVAAVLGLAQETPPPVPAEAEQPAAPTVEQSPAQPAPEIPQETELHHASAEKPYYTNPFSTYKHLFGKGAREQRATRKEFWLSFLWCHLPYIILMLLSGIVYLSSLHVSSIYGRTVLSSTADGRDFSTILFVAGTLWLIVTVLPLTMRRLRDVGCPPVFAMLVFCAFLPLAGFWGFLAAALALGTVCIFASLDSRKA